MNQVDTTIQSDLLDACAKAQENLVNYRAILLSTGDQEVDPAKFHYDWSDSVLLGSNNEAFEAFRESAKSQYILRAFPLYSLTFPKKKTDYIVLIKNTQTLAENKLKEIEEEFLSNPVISANLVSINQQSGKVFDVVLKDPDGQEINVRIEAYGKGASIRGLANQDRRPKIVVIDDPQDMEDSKSETVLENDWKWFLDDVMFLGKTTRIFLIGNNLGEKCIIERVFANAAELNFKCSRIPILDKDGNPTWETQFNKTFVDNEKANYVKLGKLDIWLRNRMCLAVSEETKLFLESDYRHYTPALAPKIASLSTVLATLDPASSKNPESCFRAITVAAIQPDGHWYIMEVPYGRWDSAVLIDKIFEVVILWGIRDFGIEKGQLLQTIEPFIIKEMTRRNCRFNIKPLEHAKLGSKLDRIKMLQPRFKSGSIWFPDEAYWLPEMKSELAGVTNYEIKSLFIDLVDSLAMMEQMTMIPISDKPIDPIKRARAVAQRAIMRR